MTRNTRLASHPHHCPKRKNRIFGLPEIVQFVIFVLKTIHYHSARMTRRARLDASTYWPRRPNRGLERPASANFDCEISLQPFHKGRFALRNGPFQDAKRPISRCKTGRFGKQKGINCKSLIFNAQYKHLQNIPCLKYCYNQNSSFIGFKMDIHGARDGFQAIG